MNKYLGAGEPERPLPPSEDAPDEAEQAGEFAKSSGGTPEGKRPGQPSTTKLILGNAAMMWGTGNPFSEGPKAKGVRNEKIPRLFEGDFPALKGKRLAAEQAELQAQLERELEAGQGGAAWQAGAGGAYGGAGAGGAGAGGAGGYGAGYGRRRGAAGAGTTAAAYAAATAGAGTSRAEMERQFQGQPAVQAHQRNCAKLKLPGAYFDGQAGPKSAEGANLIEPSNPCAHNAPVSHDETLRGVVKPSRGAAGAENNSSVSSDQARVDKYIRTHDKYHAPPKGGGLAGGVAPGVVAAGAAGGGPLGPVKAA